jgi:hypothetical protein
MTKRPRLPGALVVYARRAVLVQRQYSAVDQHWRPFSRLVRDDLANAFHRSISHSVDHQPVLMERIARGGHRSVLVVLALWITCIVVLPTLALVFYVVRRSRPGRFRLSATLLKLASINIQVDADVRSGELPDQQPQP